MTDPGTGLIVYRASRLEALLEPLQHLLETQLPDDVLAPQRVIAAHPGLRQWLSGALARRCAAKGIVANLEIQLPSAWLEQAAGELLGESAVALTEYRRDRLRWRIFSRLALTADAQVSHYLADDASGLRRYQLADRLAHLYSQYMVYRPAWMQKWQDGLPAGKEAGFQADLWRWLRKQIGQAHRGELLGALTELLANGADGLPTDPLHVFGVSHLAPAEIRLLAAVAKHRTVVMYVPDPCTRYWGDQRSEGSFVGLPRDREGRYSLQDGEPFSDETEAQFLESVGHPLLARWGRMGQHFMLGIEEAQPEVDIRHWQDEQSLDDSRPQPLLARVQQSIRELTPDLVATVPAEDGMTDASLRLHVCHTRLRELEVLRDALLAARSERPALKTSEIVVMAPDIAAYVPYIAAVFGPPGDRRSLLPYHLADVTVARTHPLFTAFQQLLAVPQSRFSAPEIVDLLRIAPVARALGLGGSDVDSLVRWLQRSGIAWALDGEFRNRQFGVPASDEHTFSWGMERLLAGYVFGQDEPGRAVRIPAAEAAGAQAIWPVDGVDGLQARLIGALDRLLLMLAGLHRDAAVERRASEWSARFILVIESMFRIDARDEDEREALASIRAIVDGLAVDTTHAGDPVLGFDVVRAVFQEKLDMVSERFYFLMGGITFCGMVPQRAIPFKFIAVLGLNDGEFPRQSRGAGLDLMLRAGNRMIGDRDVRNDDRYLFLETVMSARERLHLSYIGEDVQDGKVRNPAAPVADLLNFLDAQHGLAALPWDKDEKDADEAADQGRKAPVALRPWRVRHPLQAFDQKYFDGRDARLFSFDESLAQPVAPTRRLPPFLSGRTATPGDGQTDPMLLASVIAWYKDPAKHLLATRMQLRRDALEDDALSADESLEASFSRLEQVPRKLLLGALVSDPPDRGIPADPPDWLRLSGQLPPGALGTKAWLDARKSAEAMLAGVDLPGAGPIVRVPSVVQFRHSGFELSGEIGDVLSTDGGARLWIFDAYAKDERDLDFKVRVPLFLRWALLRLQCGDQVDVGVCLLLKSTKQTQLVDSYAAWCARFKAEPALRAELRSELAGRVCQVLDLYREALVDTCWYFPKTSWAALADDCLDAVSKAWHGADGDWGKGEIKYAPGYSAAFARDVSIAEQLDDLQATARRLAAAIDLDSPLDVVASSLPDEATVDD